MKPRLLLSEVPPGTEFACAREMLDSVGEDLWVIASEVDAAAAARAAAELSPEIALVCPLGMHCSLKGLTLPRSASERVTVTLATRWSVADLDTRLQRLYPGRRSATWCNDLEIYARHAPDGELLVAIASGPELRMMVRGHLIVTATASTMPAPAPEGP